MAEETISIIAINHSLNTNLMALYLSPCKNGEETRS